jgi:hypothetical protein
MMYFAYEAVLSGVIFFPIAAEAAAFVLLGLLLISALAIALAGEKNGCEVHEGVRKMPTGAACDIENVITGSKGLLTELETAA